MGQKPEYDPGFRAAGYCGAEHPTGKGCCTKSPGHSGDHVDHYTGRTSVMDVEGTRWNGRRPGAHADRVGAD